MKYDEAVERLRNHSNFPGTKLSDTESFGFALVSLKLGDRQDSFSERLPDLFGDVLSCLTCLNFALNGEIPSESADVSKQLQIDRWLVYAVNGIFMILIDAQRYPIAQVEKKQLADMLERLIAVWDHVLAGDIDDLETGI